MKCTVVMRCHKCAAENRWRRTTESKSLCRTQVHLTGVPLTVCWSSFYPAVNWAWGQSRDGSRVLTPDKINTETLILKSFSCIPGSEPLNFSPEEFSSNLCLILKQTGVLQYVSVVWHYLLDSSAAHVGRQHCGQRAVDVLVYEELRGCNRMQQSPINNHRAKHQGVNLIQTN